MSRILLVSYYYPPYPYGGSIRFKSLFDYLKKKKHNVTLITSSEGKESAEDENIILIEDKFKREINGNSRSFLRSLNPLPDTMSGWSMKVAKYIENNFDDYDRIIITAPPFSLPMILAFRHDREYLSKIILDVRDMLYEGSLRDYTFFYPKLFDKIIEKRIAEKFKNITTNVFNHEKILRKRYNVASEVILNSYDDYSAEKIDIKHPAFVYAGKIDKIRFNKTLFDGFNKSLNVLNGYLYIAGEDVESRMKDYASENVIYLGKLSREDAENLIYSSDVCLMMHSFKLSDFESVFSYKITDYSKYVKPIVYVGPKTEASKFIKEKSIGICVNEDSPDAVSEALINALKISSADITKLFKDTFIDTSFDL